MIFENFDVPRFPPQPDLSRIVRRGPSEPALSYRKPSTCHLVSLRIYTLTKSSVYYPSNIPSIPMENADKIPFLNEIFDVWH
jgi:hypothetical protein